MSAVLYSLRDGKRSPNLMAKINQPPAIITEALTVAEEHMAWAATQPGGMKLAAYGIGLSRLCDLPYHHNKRRAIITAAVAAAWMEIPKA